MLYINPINKMKKHLINIKCDDFDSFKYSILLYLYYYNVKTNYNRPSEIDQDRDPYIKIIFNRTNNITEFEKDNPLIDLLIFNTNDKPLFLTRNNASIEITIVKLNDYRYSLDKPTLECFNNNINKINKIGTNTPKIYKLTDEIKKDLRLDLKHII